MTVHCGAIAATIAILALTVNAHAAEQTQTPSRDIVTFQVTNHGTREDDLAVTFGSVFVRNDVPRGAQIEAVDRRGATIPIQVDRKTTHADGSLRHAVLTLDMPHLDEGGEETVTLRRSDSEHAVGGKAIALSDLPANFDALVSLNLGGRHLTASARALLAAAKPEVWLSGPLVGEWWVHGPFKDDKGVADPYLDARFGIRCYGKGRPLRIDVVVENDWTFVPHPQTMVYDAEIRANGKSIFARNDIVQPSHTRWRKVFWWDEPVSVYVRQNLDYLRAARVIPNYDPELRISEAALAKMYARFQGTDRDPMGSGLITGYMPMTGGRLDIAPLPQWQAMYLLSMDPRAYEMTLQNADLGASFRSHYRNEKTGRPVTVADDPNITWNSNLAGRSGEQEHPNADDGQMGHSLIPDPAHEPALDFIPYLVTGDRFYLEELEFWSQWNEMGSAPVYRGYGAGLLKWNQIRGQAWSLRTLAQAAYIAPDDDPLKSELLRQLKANISWYEQNFSSNPSANKLGILDIPGKLLENGFVMYPWPDDVFTWSVGYVQALGDVDAMPLLRWKARFSVGRMTAPGFCWILAASFRLRIRDPETGQIYPSFDKIYQATLPDKIKNHAANPNPACGSADMANALGLSQPGEMIQNARGPDGYPAYMQPALAAAVDADAPGALAAWKLFQSRPVKPDYSKEPGWDIVPFSPGRPSAGQ